MTRIEEPRGFDPARTITVVSGLPRSGTSLMMQMLEAAGLTLATDRHRAADLQNPKGYFELDAVRRLPKDSTFLASAIGRVVKVVSPLIMFLPPEYDYRLILMERDLAEVLASQRAMLEHDGGDPVDPSNDELLAQAFRHEQEKVDAWLAERNNIRTCRVSHQQVMRSPATVSEDVFSFLIETNAFSDGRAGDDFQAQIQNRMAAVVDPRLHRHRE